MATFTIHDGASEFRIEIAGKFVGACVPQVEQRWRQALAESLARTVTVDITRISDYDQSGRKLLRSMHKHGTTIAASTPRSLVLLSDIAAAPRRGPLPEVVQRFQKKPNGRSESRPETQQRAAGAGHE